MEQLSDDDHDLIMNNLHPTRMSGEKFKQLYVRKDKIIPNKVKEIDGTLRLGELHIRKIENLPKIINGDLNLHNNEITKIENLPEIIKGDLSLIWNNISTVENLPKKVDGIIYLWMGNELVMFKKTNSKFKMIKINGEDYSRKEYDELVRDKNKKRNLKRFKDIL